MPSLRICRAIRQAACRESRRKARRVGRMQEREHVGPASVFLAAWREAVEVELPATPGPGLLYTSDPKLAQSMGDDALVISNTRVRDDSGYGLRSNWLARPY